MRNGKTFYVTLTVALILTSAAFAQTQNVDPKAGDPKACANGAPNSSGTLSDKLSQSNGVICPPNVDQGMKAPTPNTGKMPVTPPLGSPGGKPDVQPK
jgi:hypothetical protein